MRKLLYLAALAATLTLSACSDQAPAPANTPAPSQAPEPTGVPTPTLSPTPIAAGTPTPAPTSTETLGTQSVPTAVEPILTDDFENVSPEDVYLEGISLIIQEKEGDNTVIATVNGRDFTTQQLRVGYESLMLMEPDLTEDEAIKATILSRLDAVLLASEAESKGLTTTRDEARALAERNKAVCEEDAEIEAECREYLEKMGLDYDEYWEEMVSVYQENHTALKAMDVLREEYQETAGQDGDGEEGQYLDWRILDSLRAETEIVWHDEDMKALFLEAQAARTSELASP